jgi:hypothetical protein
MGEYSKKKLVNALRILYPLWAVIGMFSIMYIPSKFLVEGDGAATAANIAANSGLFGLGIAGTFVTQLFQIVVVLVLYKLFKDVNKDQAILTVIFGFFGAAIAFANVFNRIAASLVLDMPDWVLFFLNLNEQGVVVASVFWGLWLLPQGYLIYKSGWFPKVFGWTMWIAGIGYFLTSFVHFIAPGMTGLLSVLEYMTFGELLFMLWVIFMGANFKKG